MRYKRVLLVNPHIPKAYMGPIRPPVGLGYLARYLNLCGVEYDILDMTLGYKLKDLLKRISDFRPDLVGVTAWTYMYKNTYRLIEAVKKAYPGGPSIVAGGPHISTLRAEVLKDCRAIDFGVVLEGEMTLAELCRGADPGKIKGLIYRDGEKVIYNGDRGFIIDLDSIPFPRYEKFEMERYFLKEILIISSRGCPYGCTYCPVKMAIGKKLRIRNAKNIAEEMAYWYNKGYKTFNFGDDNFTFFKERVSEICGEIIRRGMTDLDLRCGNGIRADKADRDLLEKMKKAGFSYIAFGVEAGNNKVLESLNKDEKIEKIEEAIKDACELGYDVTLFFLAGSPGETREDIEDSVRLARRYPVIDARFYNIIPYPSTGLFEYLKENNLFLRDPKEYLNDASAFGMEPVFETPELPRAERLKVLRYLRRVRSGILRRGLERRLRQYGIAGKFGAALLSTDFGQNMIRYNKSIRRMAEKVRQTF